MSRTSWPVAHGASENLKVTERFTRTGPDTILYRFTMDDPEVFTASFTGELPFTKIDEQVYEYAFYGTHPVPYDQGGGYCYQQGPHYHQYAPFDQNLFRQSSGYYYLIRGKNGCGGGTYGTQTGGAQRTPGTSRGAPSTPGAGSDR